MSVPQDRRYLQSHEWHQLTGDVVTIGITQTAADELTDITYVKLPAVGATIAANSPFGEVESVKATSDLYSGVTGTVSAVNAELTANPGLVNTDPFGKGWMIKVKVTDTAQMAKLLSADDYLKKTGH
ncbi:MAG TPA: glycine cleavage system protein GcvH [Tepidisphaeraceae bacterium]|jgi:glycine cleavage system H protein